MAGEKTVREEGDRSGDDVEGIEVAQTHKRDIRVLEDSEEEVEEEADALPPIDKWPDKPLLLRESCVHMSRKGSNGRLAMESQVHSFETDLFVGEIMVRLRSHSESASYFEGKKRLSSILITGKFKQDVGLSEVFTGQEFSFPVRKPSDFIVSAILKFFKLLAPLLRIHCSDEQFYSLSPLAQTVQVIHISDQPVKLSPDLVLEDNFGEVELDKKMTREERKKYFSQKENLEGRTFSVDKHYAFDFYNDKVDLETFCLKVMGMEFDLQDYIRRQPLRVLARTAQQGDPRDQYLWNFEIWHQKVTLQPCERDSEESSSDSS